MRKFERWLIGLTCAITLCENNLRSVTLAHVCELEENSLHQKVADCNNKGLEKVPDDLPANIQVLLLNFNNQIVLEENTFENNSDLVEIFLQHLKKSSKPVVAHVNTFFSLKKLEKVHMGNSGYDTVFNWPENVHELYFDNNPFKVVNVENLPNLKTIEVSRCQLLDLPKPHKSAIVDYLWAENNPFPNLTADSLSHYCNLSSLRISFHQPNDGEKEEFCRCLKIKKWLMMTEFTTVAANVSCDSTKTESSCNLNFSRAESNRKDCFGALSMLKSTYNSSSTLSIWSTTLLSNSTSQPPPPSFPSWLLYILIIVGIAILLLIILCCYNMLILNTTESEIKVPGDDEEEEDEEEA